LIKYLSETLLNNSEEDEETSTNFLKINNEESHSIKLLIDDLLILSKLEKDELEIEPIELSTKKLFEDIRPIIEQKAEEKDIKFECLLSNEIIFEAEPE